MPRNTTSKAIRSASVSGTSTMTAVLVIVLAAAGFGGGFLLGQSMGAKKNYDRGHAAGWEEAKKKVGESPVFARTGITTTLIGTVTAVGDSSFEMQTPSTQANPLEKESPGTRTVMVDAETAILLLVDKSADEIMKERSEFDAAAKKYREAVEAGENPEVIPPPAPPVTEKKVTLRELKAGMSVEVIGKTGEDLLQAESFTAASVRVMTSSPSAPSAERPIPPPVR